MYHIDTAQTELSQDMDKNILTIKYVSAGWWLCAIRHLSST